MDGFRVSRFRIVGLGGLGVWELGSGFRASGFRVVHCVG